MDIVIKKLSPDTVQKDKFLCLNPPLRTVVSIDLIHNHTINTAAALKLLRVPEEEKFHSLPKSDVSNKQKGQSSINAYRHPMMPDDSEMSEEEKEVWEEFARARLFTFDCPYPYNDFEGMGLGFFKGGKNIFAPGINFYLNDETRPLLARLDRNTEELYTLWHQSRTLEKQVDPVYSQCYLNDKVSDERFMSKVNPFSPLNPEKSNSTRDNFLGTEHFPPLQNSSFSNKYMEQEVSEKLFWKKPMPDGNLTCKGQSPFVEKCNASGKQTVAISDGHRRKKRLSQKIRKLEAKEEDKEILEIFVPSRYFKNIHRSGDAVSVYDDPNRSLLSNNIIYCGQKEEEWKKLSEDPVSKSPALFRPVEPLPELPALSYDEDPWGDEFYF